jgi:2-dehydro-3-deoxyphosphooctonate aldolase (KDO 8-P synthase)
MRYPVEKVRQTWARADAQRGAEQTREGREVWLCERGNSFGYNNLVVDFRNISDMLDIVPRVIMDCTHSVQRPGGGQGFTAGDRRFVPPMALAAKAFGANGFFFEVHPEPDKALSDGPNMLQLSELKGLIEKLA